MGDILGLASIKRATTGGRKAAVCTAFRTNVLSIPPATSLSLKTPAKEAPMAMASQGTNEKKLEALRFSPVEIFKNSFIICTFIVTAPNKLNTYP